MSVLEFLLIVVALVLINFTALICVKLKRLGDAITENIKIVGTNLNTVQKDLNTVSEILDEIRENEDKMVKAITQLLEIHEVKELVVGEKK